MVLQTKMPADNETAAWRQRRLTLHVLRATSVRVRTALSAELLPPLRQTARCRLASLSVNKLVFCFDVGCVYFGLNKIFTTQFSENPNNSVSTACSEHF